MTRKKTEEKKVEEVGKQGPLTVEELEKMIEAQIEQFQGSILNFDENLKKASGMIDALQMVLNTIKSRKDEGSGEADKTK